VQQLLLFIAIYFVSRLRLDTKNSSKKQHLLPSHAKNTILRHVTEKVQKTVSRGKERKSQLLRARREKVFIFL
jgi:hypothetical protein